MCTTPENADDRSEAGSTFGDFAICWRVVKTVLEMVSSLGQYET